MGLEDARAAKGVGVANAFTGAGVDDVGIIGIDKKAAGATALVVGASILPGAEGGSWRGGVQTEAVIGGGRMALVDEEMRGMVRIC